MRKMISVLMCFALLLSCCTFAAADDSPQLAVVAYRDNTAWIGSDVHEDYVCFDILASNCEQLESFELLITYNPAVLAYSAHYPFLLDEIVRNSIDCTVTEPGKLSVIGINNGYGTLKKEFNPFCFKVIGAGDTDIFVELVSFKTADGEVENVAFDADIQNFTATVVFVKYDLTGDDIVTAEDARLALRFAVGLDSATDAQCRAAGVAAANDFTAEIARTILRRSVGL